MTIVELAKWLGSRDHQVTVCFRIETQGLYIKMIDMKTGMIRMCLLSDLELHLSNFDSFDVFESVLDRMYKELMDALQGGDTE